MITRNLIKWNSLLLEVELWQAVLVKRVGLVKIRVITIFMPCCEYQWEILDPQLIRNIEINPITHSGVNILIVPLSRTNIVFFIVEVRLKRLDLNHPKNRLKPRNNQKMLHGWLKLSACSSSSRNWYHKPPPEQPRCVGWTDRLEFLFSQAEISVLCH